MVKHTRPMAVNHSLPPNQDRGRSPLKIKINNKIMIRIGPKTGGGQMDMPPRINHTGAQIMTGVPTVAGLHNPGAQTMDGRHIMLICSPSPTQNVSCPGWNPGTPLTFAETLSMRFLILVVPRLWDHDRPLMPFVPRVWTTAFGPNSYQRIPTFHSPTATPLVSGKNAEFGFLPILLSALTSKSVKKAMFLSSCRFLR